MRIGIDGRYVQDYFPGIGRYTYSLVRALGAVDQSDEYVVYFDPRQANSRYDLNALEQGTVRLRPVHAPAFSLVEQIVLPLAAHHDRVDVFHSPYYVKPYALPCPSVVTIHDAIGARHPQLFSSLKARLSFTPAMRLAILTSRAVIVPSRAALDDLVRFFGVAIERAAVIYEGADELSAETPSVRAVGALDEVPARFLLFVGANKPHKNLVRLLRAYAQAGIEPHLVVVGREDPRFPEARREVKALGLKDRVHFRGEVSDDVLRQLYGSADALVLPSLVEGFGLPALEALACGTPVICSDAGSLPEVVGDAALTFDPTSVQEMSAALVAISRDPSLRADLARRGRQRARCFSWKRAAIETLELYRRVGGRR